MDCDGANGAQWGSLYFGILWSSAVPGVVFLALFSALLAVFGTRTHHQNALLSLQGQGRELESAMRTD